MNLVLVLSQCKRAFNMNFIAGTSNSHRSILALLKLLYISDSTFRNFFAKCLWEHVYGIYMLVATLAAEVLGIAVVVRNCDRYEYYYHVLRRCKVSLLPATPLPCSRPQSYLSHNTSPWRNIPAMPFHNHMLFHFRRPLLPRTANYGMVWCIFHDFNCRSVFTPKNGMTFS